MIKISKLIFIVITMLFVASQAYAAKYNLHPCSKCDSGDASSYFNRKAGKSPVYYADINAGKLVGYERYTINEPGYPNWYGVREASVPKVIKDQFDKVFTEVKKLRYNYEHNNARFISFSAAGDQDGIWIPEHLATSPWDLTADYRVQKNISDHLISGTFQNFPEVIIPVFNSFTLLMGFSFIQAKMPGISTTVNFGNYNYETGLWSYKGSIDIILVKKLFGETSGTYDWSTAYDAENNLVPSERKIGISNYYISKDNRESIGNASRRMQWNVYHQLIRETRNCATAISCAGPTGPCLVLHCW